MAAVVVSDQNASSDMEAGSAPASTASQGASSSADAGGEAKSTSSSQPKGTPRFVKPDKTLADGEEPFSEDEAPGDARLASLQEERDSYADLDPKVYRALRPAGKAIARILDEAMYPEPEEEPIYYWDEEYEGDPEDLTTAQIAFHNAHWAGYRTLKGAETLGEFFAGFLGMNQSRYQWVIDAKKREDERQKQEELENRQRRWLIAQAKLRRESILAKKQGKQEENLEGGIVSGDDSSSSSGSESTSSDNDNA